MSNEMDQYRKSLSPLIEGLKDKERYINKKSSNGHPGDTVGGSSFLEPQDVEPPAITIPSRQSTTSTNSLDAYISNIFQGVFIQDNNDEFERIYAEAWISTPTDMSELANKPFYDFVVAFRARLTCRKLVDQSLVMVPAVTRAEADQVTVKGHISGLVDGKEAEDKIFLILKIENNDGWRRVMTESFTLNTD